MYTILLHPLHPSHPKQEWNNKILRKQSCSRRILILVCFSPSPWATGVCREAIECGFGPTKGSKTPLATEGRAGERSSYCQKSSSKILDFTSASPGTGSFGLAGVKPLSPPTPVMLLANISTTFTFRTSTSGCKYDFFIANINYEL